MNPRAASDRLKAPSGGSSGLDPRTVTVSTSAQSLSFEANFPMREHYPSARIPLELTGARPGEVYVVLEKSAGPEIQFAYQEFYDETTGVYVLATLPSVLGPGSYGGELTIRVCTREACVGESDVVGSPLVVPFTYVISGFWASGPALSFSTGATHVAADLVRTFVLGGAPSAWTAASDVPWLVVDPASGASGRTLVTASVPEAELAKLASGTYPGHLTFTPESGVPYTMDVTLRVATTFTGRIDASPSWSFVSGQGGARLTRSDGVYTFDPGETDTNQGAVGVYANQNFTFEQGRRYRLYVRAWADAPRTFSGSVGSTIPPYDYLPLGPWLLTATPQWHVTTFVPTEEIRAGNIYLSLGGDPGNVYFSDTLVREVP